MASNDPDFERKATDVIGLYLNPPRHAAVFCVDEKTAIQALDRRDRMLPLSPGRAERRGFEYKRNGTLSLYAALNTQTGQVHGKTAARHTSQDFVEFLGEVVALCRPGQEIHIILDNLSAHKTKKVAAFLDQHPNLCLHFTPTYSSWLNQIELWFSKLQRDVIARSPKWRKESSEPSPASRSPTLSGCPPESLMLRKTVSAQALIVSDSSKHVAGSGCSQRPFDPATAGHRRRSYARMASVTPLAFLEARCCLNIRINACRMHCSHISTVQAS